MKFALPLIDRLCADHNKAHGTDISVLEFLQLHNNGNVTATARKLGISRTYMLRLVDKYDLPVKKNQWYGSGKIREAFGVEASIAELARIHGIRENLVHTRLCRGWTLEEALDGKRMEKRTNGTANAPFEYEGFTMTIREHAKRKGYDQKTAWTRYINGWDVEKIFITPLRNYKSNKNQG